MFFDRLFTLTSLKARLLGSSSFAQLYSAERLPLHKFRREGAMLSPWIAGLLAACGGGGNDVLRAANGPAQLFGGKGDDELFGGPARDVLYGDEGRDNLTGNGGSAIFVAQPISDAILDNDRSLLKSKFYDFVEDFKIGEDKIGIVDFSRIDELAKQHDYDYGAARAAYFENLEKRADEASKTQMALMLDDLGFYFQLLNPPPEFDIPTGDKQLYWSLIDRNRVDPNDSNAQRDDTALLLFRSAKFSIEQTGRDYNPFLDLDPALGPQSFFEFI